MLRLLVAALVGLIATVSSSSAQAPVRRANLTGTVVVVNQQSDSITLIDLKTMEAYRHVAVVGGPHEAAASPDGRSVVVTSKPLSRAVHARWQVCLGAARAGVFPHPDNRHAFVTVRNDNSMLVDLVSGETLGRVEVQNSPDGVTYSPVQRP